MTKTDPILLYHPSDEAKHVRISTYKRWCNAKKKDDIADFIYKRHYWRYIKPFEFEDLTYIKEYNNGFAIMACCCLLIETLESFYRGLAQSRNELNFLKFFTRDEEFKEFAIDDIPSQFYKHIRCGILHQGETTGGWTINRKSAKLLDKSNRKINASLFLKKLKQSLENYRETLKNSDWNSPVWENLRDKLKSVLKNCA